VKKGEGVRNSLSVHSAGRKLDHDFAADECSSVLPTNIRAALGATRVLHIIKDSKSGRSRDIRSCGRGAAEEVRHPGVGGKAYKTRICERFSSTHLVGGPVP